jgi:Bardet-Biedl syndrome 5 protein
MLNSVVAVHKAYDSSRLYREIRLRSSLLNKGQLRLLPKERLHNRYNGVWNLSSDQVEFFSEEFQSFYFYFF